MINICTLLLSCLSLEIHDSEFKELKKTCAEYLPQIQGWCSSDKAHKMMDLIYQVKPKVCVEIGVFGGSSIYPTALALKHQNQGVVYAIDPWSKQACLEGYDAEDPNYKWWGSLDLDSIYFGFLKMLSQKKLNSFVKVMRCTSTDALNQFDDESIDILHIDGNHTKDVALTDAYLYFPKVKKGGYIWFDDVNWHSTTSAQLYLLEKCEYIDEYSTDSFALFRK